MDYEKRVIKLQENIYGVKGIWMNGMSFFNTYAYILRSEESGRLLLIDTCGPQSGEIIKYAVELMGASMSDITGIALTHWHKDHTGSLAEIAGMAATPDRPVNVFIHKDDSLFLTSQRRRILKMHPVLKFRVLHSPGTLPEKSLHNLIELDNETGINPLSDYGVEFIHTPGHTPGHTSYLHRKSMTLFSGCGLSLFGRNSVGVVPVFYDRKMQLDSAKRLMELEFDYLCSAHMNVRRDVVRRDMRVPFKGKVSFVDRATGTLPLFRYPKK